MGNILYNISQVLGITIIHSLWQGLLIYFILRIVFIAASELSPVKKYNLAIAAIASMFLWFIYTLLTEVNACNWVNLKSFNTLPLLPFFNISGTSQHFIPEQSIYYTIAGYLPYISAIYIAGLTANLLKLGWEWNKIRLIKQSIIPAEQMQQYINTFSKKLDISKHIQLKFSNWINVPCMVGYFKPIIFLPVTIATRLSACEIEAILLHELSHIKRNDYLINLLQQFINVILFFNPFALLVNRIINRERENCCDDLVVEKTDQPLIYARALLKLEETRISNLQFALSATGKKYHLLNRIERIMETKKSIGNTRHLLIAIFLMAGALGSIAWFNPKAAGANTSITQKVIAKLNPLNDREKEQPELKIYNSQFITKNDSNKNISVNDTIKHHHKGKITIVDKNGNKKEYDSTDSLPQEVKKQLKAVRKQFNSPEWKARMEAIKKQGEEMRKQFDSPEWKAQMETMKKQGEEMKKHFDSPEWKAQMLAMQKQGEEMKKQFESPEWKAQMEAMQKQGEEIKKKFNSIEWKSQMENMQKQAEEMKKQFNSAEWKNQMENMKKQGEEMRKKFESPEWKAQMENMKMRAEKMAKQFNSPEWKAQMEEMKKQAEKMKNQLWDSKDSVNFKPKEN